MPRYEKLPKGTPSWLTLSIILIGGCLGVSIGIHGLLSLYGFTGFLVGLFFPSVPVPFEGADSVFLGTVGILAGITTTMLGFLAFDMNILSKKALKLSKITWIPTLLLSLLLVWNYSSSTFQYHISGWWLIGTISSIVLGSLLPYLLLRTPASQKVHKR